MGVKGETTVIQAVTANDEAHMTVKEVAAALKRSKLLPPKKCTDGKVYSWIYSGKIRAKDFRLPRAKQADWRVTQSELDRVLMCIRLNIPLSVG